jgi:hypothetical protein
MYFNVILLVIPNAQEELTFERSKCNLLPQPLFIDGEGGRCKSRANVAGPSVKAHDGSMVLCTWSCVPLGDSARVTGCTLQVLWMK